MLALFINVIDSPLHITRVFLLINTSKTLSTYYESLVKKLAHSDLNLTIIIE